ncbi:MAG: hypothetical protein NVS4B3_22340 [Gemmatimonadaceae bacterium]
MSPRGLTPIAKVNTAFGTSTVVNSNVLLADWNSPRSDEERNNAGRVAEGATGLSWQATNNMTPSAIGGTKTVLKLRV